VTSHTDPGAAHPAVTYSSYLALDDLLAAQHPRSDEHDELLFIVIHQTYELWFKQLLHELAYLQRTLESGNTPHSEHALRRVLTIFKTIVAQVDVLETMTPRQFTSFRGRLAQSSGFQSAQFRELEAVLGRRDPKVFEHYPAGPERQRIADAMDDGDAARVAERLVDLDEGLMEWRYRHVKMVERTIGMKPGTGGSAGAAYLRTTLDRPMFPDLWAIRSAL
jgi:tryptophan 2,3-dioxygenase